MKFFYSHLIEIETITTELDKMNLSPNEKLHLANLIDESLHHTILDAIFSELKAEDKKTLVTHLSEGKHDKIWNFLNTKVDNVEDKIKKAADELKVEMHKDLQEAKKIHS